MSEDQQGRRLAPNESAHLASHGTGNSSSTGALRVGVMRDPAGPSTSNAVIGRPG
jgi:hypothetical protein